MCWKMCHLSCAIWVVMLCQDLNNLQLRPHFHAEATCLASSCSPFTALPSDPDPQKPWRKRWQGPHKALEFISHSVSSSLHLDLHSFNSSYLSILLHPFSNCQNFIPSPKLCDANATKSRNATLFVAHEQGLDEFIQGEVGGWDCPPNKGAATSPASQARFEHIFSARRKRRNDNEQPGGPKRTARTDPCSELSRVLFLDFSHLCPFFPWELFNTENVWRN